MNHGGTEAQRKEGEPIIKAGLGVRPSPGAATFELQLRAISPTGQNITTLLRPGTGALRRNPQSAIHNPQSAFTLLEIMVAIALLAMVVVAIYASWNSILKGSRVALDAAAASQRTRITMRTVQDSLLCACMFTGNPTNYSFDVSSESDFSSLSFVARLPKSFPRGGKFGDLQVRRLEFTVESGTESKNQLVLRQRPLISDFTKDEAEHPLVLARNVVKFLVEFIDPKTGEWISEWTYTNQLPREARITVGMGHLDQFSDKAQDVRVAVVALPAVSVPQQLQPVGGGGIPNQNGASNAVNNGLNNGLNNGNNLNNRVNKVIPR